MGSHILDVNQHENSYGINPVFDSLPPSLPISHCKFIVFASNQAISVPEFINV